MTSTALRLQDLPSEVLQTILDRDASHLALQLWKCGSLTLNERLAKGGCIHMVLRDRALESNSRFPIVLSEFQSLRSLVIKRGDNHLDRPAVIRAALGALGGSLEQLHLECFGLESVFWPGGPSIDGESIVGGMWNVGERMSRLQTLILRNQTGPISSFTPYDFARLPSSLLHLEIQPEVCHSGILERTDLLPRGLQTMRVGFAEGFFGLSLEACRNLPPTLTELSSQVRFVDTESSMKVLPLTLTKLDWRRRGDLQLLLPPHLTEASIADNHPLSEWKLLPATLQQLMLGDNTVLNGEFLQILPRTLVALGTTSNPLHDWASIRPHHFPPTLTSFEGHCTPEHFHRLPQSLQTLCVSFDRDPDISCLLDLPRDLTRLSLWLPSAVCSITPEALLELPSTLKSLEIAQVESLALNCLPESLTALRIHVSPYFDGNCLTALPPRLISLIVRGETISPVFAPSTLFKSLPRTLRTLIAEFSLIKVRKSDLSAMPDLLTRLALPRIFGGELEGQLYRLPSFLVRLDLGSALLHTLDIRDLPRHVEHLKRPIIKYVEPRNLLELPPRLKTLQCSFPYSTLEADDFRLLPRSLQTVEIEDCPNWKKWKNKHSSSTSNKTFRIQTARAIDGLPHCNIQ